jgi:nucleotide-binding universal stress UspA family protein
MKILLAVDGSKSADHAVRCLIRHVAWLRDAPVVDVVFVHLPVRPVGTIHGISAGNEALAQYYEQGAQQMLTACKRALIDAGVGFQTHLLIGDPAEAITRFAQEHRADMIFMGTRGMSTIGNLFLGSTANKVLHLAQVPVVLVPMERVAKHEAVLASTIRT